MEQSAFLTFRSCESDPDETRWVISISRADLISAFHGALESQLAAEVIG
jgi:hypothetical protein